MQAIFALLFGCFVLLFVSFQEDGCPTCAILGSSIIDAQGIWDGRTAGGCTTHPTWRWNQQIFFMSEEKKEAKVKLIQNTKEHHYIGFYICKTDGNMHIVHLVNLFISCLFPIEILQAAATLLPVRIG